jgi:hypothetical protein
VIAQNSTIGALIDAIAAKLVHDYLTERMASEHLREAT